MSKSIGGAVFCLSPATLAFESSVMLMVKDMVQMIFESSMFDIIFEVRGEGARGISFVVCCLLLATQCHCC